jgi:uncharacterized protein (TIRG00374 family)
MTDRESRRPAYRRLLAWLPGVLVLIGLGIVLLQFAELESLLEVLGALSLASLLVAAVPQLATYAATASIWYLVLRRARHRRQFAALYLLGIAKLFIDQALPSGGLSGSLLIASALRRRGVSTPVATAALLVAAISFHIALTIGAAVSVLILMLHHALGRVAVLSVIGCLIIALVLLGAILWLRRRRGSSVDRWVGRLPMLRRAWDAIRAAPAALLTDVPLLLAATALQLCIIALDGATLWILLQALGAAAPYGSALAAFVLASIIADLVPIPLGLGSFEAALVGLLTLSHIGLAIAAATTLLFRGLSFWLPMIPGLWLARRELRTGQPKRLD